MGRRGWGGASECVAEPLITPPHPQALIESKPFASAAKKAEMAAEKAAKSGKKVATPSPKKGGAKASAKKKAAASRETVIGSQLY